MQELDEHKKRMKFNLNYATKYNHNSIQTTKYSLVATKFKTWGQI
uniref:Uncharacterized protein n=1 Tax=Rhizophora mucronata TaxID=61149 RepID=A0A2P2PW80_RHIMU